jgi:hypothetical protein
MRRAKTGFMPDTGSVMAQVLVPLWSVMNWVFIDVSLILIISSSNHRIVVGVQ